MRKKRLTLTLTVASVFWFLATVFLFFHTNNKHIVRSRKVNEEINLFSEGVGAQLNDSVRLFKEAGELKTKLLEEVKKLQLHRITAHNSPPVIAVLILVCNRPLATYKIINRVLEIRPSDLQFPVIVSQDCQDSNVTNVLRDFEDMVNVIKQPDNSKIHVNKIAPYDLEGYHKISRHYRYALTTVFEVFNYKAAIILEDDLELSPDLFVYFQALYPILVADPSLFCITAYNDNGKRYFVSEEYDLLYRTDFFSGLGWLMTHDLWKEWKPRWPKVFWDDWAREPEQRRNRSCIRPEVSRTKTNGDKGVSLGQYNKFLNLIQLNNRFVDFRKKNLTYLLKDTYDLNFVNQVYNCPLVTLEEFQKSDIKHPVRITYTNGEEFGHIVRVLHLMPDLKANVPRTAYRGIVTSYIGGTRVFIAPPPTWKGYG